MKRLTIGSLTLLPLLLLSSCKSTQTFRDQEVFAFPASFTAKESETVEVKRSLLQLFSTPELTATVNRALENNPELRAAQARLEELGFNLEKSGAAQYPSLSANGSAGRRKTAIIPAVSSYSATLDARWEVDVWGRIRSGVRASQANRDAAAADLEAARQSLAAQTMQAWFQLVAAEKTLELDHRRIASFDSTASLVQRRFELGSAALADVDLARTDLENARADVEASFNRRNQAARGLRVLTGDYPDAALRANAWPSLRAGVPAGIPSDLLLNRPDIKSAYQNVLAADAQVKVAHADLFPSFVLTGSAGRESNTLSDVLKSGFDIWSIAGNVSGPLFEAGQRRNEVDAAGKRTEQAFRQYQATVLNALREVENALGSETLLAREEKARDRALETAHSAADLSRRDYEAGIRDILSLLEAQRRVFITEQRRINIQAARLNNRVALALALGKGN
jgi:NodT family efflux transporter outer membrane factor (OMF) lipoprotein